MKLRPSNDRVVIKREKDLVQKFGTIIIRDTKPKKYAWGVVEEVGAGYASPNTGQVFDTVLKPGDRVLYPKGSCQSSTEHSLYKMGREDVIIDIVGERDVELYIRESEIIAMFNTVIGTLNPIVERLVNGIVIPAFDAVDDTLVHATAHYVGFGRRAGNGAFMPMSVRKGDTFIINKWDAWEFVIAEEDRNGYVIVKENEIIAVLEE